MRQCLTFLVYFSYFSELISSSGEEVARWKTLSKAFEKPLTSVEPGSSNDDDRLQKTVSFDDTVEVSEIPSNSKEGKTEEEAAKEDKKLKKKKKKEKKERKEKKKRDEKSKNSMLESWLNDSAADHESSVSPELQER